MENSGTIELRRCHKCGKNQALTEFSRNRSKLNGINTQCKTCGRQYDRDYRSTLTGRAIRAFHHSREKSRKLGRASTVTSEEVLALFENTKRCVTCDIAFDRSERSKRPSLDHIYPISSELGGENHVFNLIILCEKCNNRKQKRHIYDFHIENDDFTPELWDKFVRIFTERLLGRPITEAEANEMTANLQAEANAWKSIPDE